MGKRYRYNVEKEKLLACVKLTTEEKLRWLEKFNRFIRTFTNDQEKRIMEEFRTGERLGKVSIVPKKGS